MATLVQFLAAGVNGAASGTATFLLRGTASSAAAVLYNDFEATAQPGTNVIVLDANGAAEVYTDAYVDVVIRNSAGTTLRTVTLGNSAQVTEVESISFTGTDYDGAPANTVGEPVTLETVLDRWIASGGAPDWQVMIDGVATDLDAAFAPLGGVFTNVQSPAFGATGDGVTDDTTAIIAANTAAAGGIVYFPPGTYKVTTASFSGVNMNWLGAGPGASVISGTTGGDMITLTDNTVSGWKKFTDLGFGSSGAYTRLFSLEESQNVAFSNCVFDGTNCSDSVASFSASAGQARDIFTDCTFVIGSSTDAALYNRSTAGNHLLSVKGCNFQVPSGFTGSILLGADFSVDGCRFDASAVTSGAYYHINAADVTFAGRYVGNFSNNRFLDGGSTGHVFNLTGLTSSCDFSESGNVFVGFTAPTATAQKGQTYDISDAETGLPGDIHLGSRKGRMLNITRTSGDFTASCCLEAEMVVIENADTSGFTLTLPQLIPGLTGTIAVFGENGAPEVSLTLADSDGEGAWLRFGAESEQVYVPSFGQDELITIGYVTLSRGTGSYRSAFTSVTQNHS